MAFNLTALADYVKDNADKVMTGLVVNSPTQDLIYNQGNLLTGVKTSERVGQLTTDPVLQPGGDCAFTPQGATAITQRAIEVAPIKVNEEFCLKDLEKKFTQLMMQKGSNPEKFPAPIEAAFVEQTEGAIAEKMERLIWQGDTNSSDPELAFIDGIIKIIDGSTGVTGSNVTLRTGTITSTTGSASVSGTGTSFTTQVAVGDKIYSNGALVGTVLSIGSNTALTLAANGAVARTAQPYSTADASQQSYGTTIAGPLTLANVSAAVDAVYLSVPQKVLDSASKPVLFMGTDAARLWLMALKNANQFHYTIGENDLRNGFDLPGFGMRVMPTPGLSGTGRMFVIRPENMWLATDMEHEEEEFDFWYSKDDQKYKLRIDWKIGVQIGYPDEVSQYRAA